jgi:hypothetical protein
VVVSQQIITQFPMEIRMLIITVGMGMLIITKGQALPYKAV